VKNISAFETWLFLNKTAVSALVGVVLFFSFGSFLWQFQQTPFQFMFLYSSIGGFASLLLIVFTEYLISEHIETKMEASKTIVEREAEKGGARSR
jgi:uncharacterized membrane protein